MTAPSSGKSRSRATYFLSRLTNDLAVLGAPADTIHLRRRFRSSRASGDQRSLGFFLITQSLKFVEEFVVIYCWLGFDAFQAIVNFFQNVNMVQGLIE